MKMNKITQIMSQATEGKMFKEEKDENNLKVVSICRGDVTAAPQ